MPKHIVIIILVILTCSSIATGSQIIKDKITTFYPTIVKEVQEHGLQGPIAVEASQYAQLRCMHEDGLDRPPDVCMNGMVPGSPNKEVVQKLYMPDCTLGQVTAKDGQGCYVIKGPRAHIMGSVAIALWYDAIINSDRFNICNEKERQIWNESKKCSYMMWAGTLHPKYRFRFHRLKKQRDKILQRVNSAYGPQGASINQNKKKMEPLFNIKD
jgi:hypothetical protein